MKKLTCLVLCLAVLVAGCQSAAPGTDPLLLRAQQVYDTALATFDALFVFEDQNQDFLESKIPGAHAKVESLRRTAKTWLPKLLSAIDTYKLARDTGGGDLATALAVVDEALDIAQELLAQKASLSGYWPSPKEMAAELWEAA